MLVLSGILFSFQTTWGHLHTSVPETQLRFLDERNGLLGGESDLLVQQNAL